MTGAIYLSCRGDDSPGYAPLLYAAVMPAENDLPADIAGLSHCQYRRVRHREAAVDVDRLAADLVVLEPHLARREVSRTLGRVEVGRPPARADAFQARGALRRALLDAPGRPGHRRRRRHRQDPARGGSGPERLRGGDLGVGDQPRGGGRHLRAGLVDGPRRRCRADVRGSARGPVVEVGAFTAPEALAYLTAKLTGPHGLPGGVLREAAELSRPGPPPARASRVATVIIDDGVSCADYRRLLADRTRSLRDLLPASPVASGDDYTRSRAGTWTLAQDRADALPPAGVAGGRKTVWPSSRASYLSTAGRRTAS